MNPFLKLFLKFLKNRFESAATKQSYDEMIANLQTKGNALTETIANKPDNAKNHETLSHIIGIERWGQRRLNVLLGQPLLADEYDGYRPPQSTPWTDLKQMFATTRAETILLVRTLQNQGVAKTTTVKHNSLGDLSIGGWLNYFVGHSVRESGQIR